MNQKKKSQLHPRNKNRDRYNIQSLLKAEPKLSTFIKLNKTGEKTVDFAEPKAVRLLNTAILKNYYGLDYWDFPNENLCPPIPGRADYIHYMADLLSEKSFGNIPKGKKVKCLDIGVGASCIYPIIGNIEYGWSFIGSDVSIEAIQSAKQIVDANSNLENIDIQFQKNTDDVLYGIIDKESQLDICICNPPFHASKEDAIKGNQRKIKNLTGKSNQKPLLNFSGNTSELVYEGGEYKFIRNYIRESEKFSKNCLWYSTLVSKQSNLKGIYKSLEKYGATNSRTISMGTGNKSTRIVAWTFLTSEEQIEWGKNRW